MVDETRFTDVMAVNGDHVEGDEIADGTSNYPTFEGRFGGGFILKYSRARL